MPYTNRVWQLLKNRAWFVQMESIVIHFNQFFCEDG